MSQPDLVLDLDLDGLLDFQTLIQACETEDEVGCVLRLHLAFERMIDFYISKAANPEMLSFAEKEKEFSRKVERAVFLGLPLTIANVARHVGQIRNKVAHELKPINRHKLDHLIKVIDENLICCLDGEKKLSDYKIELVGKSPDEVVRLGTHGDRYDFIVAVAAALHCSGIIIGKRLALDKAKQHFLSAINLTA
ncbi:hypothetical protein [Pseudomonas soli]|uniref:hypothetical protein n=1 Tax=Pseudomonas soli TaxID=1306993 RepID=UPI003DA99B9B